MPDGKLTDYGKFIKYLADHDKRLTPYQNSVAQDVLSMPKGGGRSWLIDRLYEFDNLNRIEDHA